MDKTRTILFLNNIYPDPRDGGIESVTHSLATELSSRGYKLLCLYLVPPDNMSPAFEIPYHAHALLDENEDLAAAIASFASEHGAGTIINNCHIHKKYDAEVIKSLSDKGFAVYNVFHASPGYDLDHIRKKYLNGNRTGVIWQLKKFINVRVRPNGYYRSRSRRVIVKHIARVEVVDKLILLSDRYKESYMSIYQIPGEYAAKIWAVGNPLRFPYSPETDHIPCKEKEVLIVARFDEWQKRISLSLDAWALVEKSGRFPDWKLTIVGHGPNEDRYLRQIEELDLKQVVLEGRKDSGPYYQRASVFMMSSAFEGFPMVLPEAMQNGVVPVVMDSFEALHDIVTDGRNGFIVPDGDVEGFAARVMELMSDQAMREEMALNAVKDIGKFSIGNIVDRWEELFRQ